MANKLLIEANLNEGISKSVKKLIGAMLSGKVKKIATKDTKDGRSFQQAVKNMRDATEEIGNIIDKHPELEELLDVI